MISFPLLQKGKDEETDPEGQLYGLPKTAWFQIPKPRFEPKLFDTQCYQLSPVVDATGVPLGSPLWD